ncbi:MAG: hypothetical protein FJW80_07850 [Actinobacteria bacterium]|nr:hypothetical protein [Actinomycetota bacterium]
MRTSFKHYTGAAGALGSPFKRVIAAAGGPSVLAAASIMAAPTAHADGDYYGTWTLTTIKTRRIRCPSGCLRP